MRYQRTGISANTRTNNQLLLLYQNRKKKLLIRNFLVKRLCEDSFLSYCFIY